MENTQDTLAEDFNTCLGYSRNEDPANLLFLPPPIGDEDVEEPNMRIPREDDREDDAELVADEELAEAMRERASLLEIVGKGKGRGRPPTTLKGTLKAIEKLRRVVLIMREIEKAD
jgi:hypothetical protein